MAKRAFEIAWRHITGNPAVNFNGKRYTFVNYDADGNVVPATAGGATIGVIQEPNDVNQPAQIMALGFSFVVLGGTVAPGDEIEVGTDGKAVKLASGKSVGICAVGGNAGDMGTVLLK